MKQFIFFAFLFCSYAVYGQDLIVTVSQDSIKCKIVDVGKEEIKFRFGTNTNLIPIKRSEVASYQYNYMMATGDADAGKTPKKKEPKEPAEKSVSSPFYAALAVGASTFGAYSVGDLQKGSPIVIGADMAYFFRPKMAVGIKANVASCKAEFIGPTQYKFDELMIFVGPVLYGRWGNDDIAFTTGAGIGALIWSMNNMETAGSVTSAMTDETNVTVGAYLSAGVNYMITEKFGIVFNAQTTIGSLTDSDGSVRKPMGIGATLGVNIRF